MRIYTSHTTFLLLSAETLEETSAETLVGPRQRPWKKPRQQSWARYLSPTEVAPEVFAEVSADHTPIYV